MPMNTKGVAEILQECAEITGNGSREKKIEFLHKNSHAAIKAVLGFCYDPKIKWLLPEGDPPYTPAGEEEDIHSTLYNDFRKLHIFVESVEYHNLAATKRESLFIDFLQSLHPSDAKLVLSIKERKLPWKGITKKLVQEAFPGISKEW